MSSGGGGVPGGGVTGHLETELKYEADSGFAVPDLAGLSEGVTVTAPESYLLTATYFDTSDLRLAAARITLRRRTGGSDAGWHLKLPAGAATRRELRAPLGDNATSVPAELASLVARWTGSAPLRPVAVLETRRAVRRLVGRGRNVLAEVADDQVTGRVTEPAAASSGEAAASAASAASAAEAGKAAPPATAGSVTWREVEVELVSGGPEILAAAGARLAAAGARPSASPSKLSRVLGALR